VLPPISKKFRVARVCFAIVQNSLVGSVISGWASLDRGMLAAAEVNGGAELTPVQTTQIFTVAASLAMGASLILGVVLDVFGPRKCAMVSCLIVASGALIVALSQGYLSIMMGLSMVAFGGPGAICSIIHISNLFPRHENLMMSLLTGTTAISVSVFAIFDTIWRSCQGITFRSIFGHYGAVVLLLAAGSYFMYPDSPFERIDDASKTTPRSDKNGTCDSSSDSNLLHHIEMDAGVSTGSNDGGGSKGQSSQQPTACDETQKSSEPFLSTVPQLDDDDAKSRPVVLNLKSQPAYVQLSTWTYARALLVFVASCFTTSFATVSLSTELNDKSAFDAATNHELTIDFTFVISLGSVASVFAGASIDRYGVIAVSFVAIGLGQLYVLLMLLAGPHRVMMEAAFVANSLFQQFMYPVFLTSLSQQFGFTNFGVLVGVGFTLGGVAQLLQATLVRYAHTTHGWNTVHIAFFVVFTVLLACPVIELREDRLKLRRRHRLAPNANSQSLFDDESIAELERTRYGSM